MTNLAFPTNAWLEQPEGDRVTPFVFIVNRSSNLGGASSVAWKLTAGAGGGRSATATDSAGGVSPSGIAHFGQPTPGCGQALWVIRNNNQAGGTVCRPMSYPACLRGRAAVDDQPPR